MFIRSLCESEATSDEHRSSSGHGRRRRSLRHHLLRSFQGGSTPPQRPAGLSVRRRSPAGCYRRCSSHPQFYSVVAEPSMVASSAATSSMNVPTSSGVGPITVDPAVQIRNIGAAPDAGRNRPRRTKECRGVRLLQAGFHNRSLALYTKLGFRTREMVSVLQGVPLGQKFPGYEVRTATPADVPACNRVCRRVHGFDREAELQRCGRAEDRLGRRASRPDHRLHHRRSPTSPTALARRMPTSWR